MTNKFHAHLDECRRCAEQPFNLCPVGARLLGAAATGTVAPVVVRKYLMLDIDGVLNSHRFFAARSAKLADTAYVAGQSYTPDESREAMLDPEAVARLNRLVERSGAHVVVSSSWRLVHTVPQIGRALRHHGFQHALVGRTPYSSIGNNTNRRGLEIATWLRDNAKEPYALVILDDSADMGELLPRLVRTTYDEGLTDEHVQLALEMLGIT